MLRNLTPENTSVRVGLLLKRLSWARSEFWAVRGRLKSSCKRTFVGARVSDYYRDAAARSDNINCACFEDILLILSLDTIITDNLFLSLYS